MMGQFDLFPEVSGFQQQENQALFQDPDLVHTISTLDGTQPDLLTGGGASSHIPVNPQNPAAYNNIPASANNYNGQYNTPTPTSTINYQALNQTLNNVVGAVTSGVSNTTYPATQSQAFNTPNSTFGSTPFTAPPPSTGVPLLTTFNNPPLASHGKSLSNIQFPNILTWNSICVVWKSGTDYFHGWDM